MRPMARGWCASAALPPGRKRDLLLSRGHWKAAQGQEGDEEHNLADAMGEQMLFRNKAHKELFRRWRRAKRRSCSTALAGKTAPLAVALCSFRWRWGLRMNGSVRILSDQCPLPPARS